VLGFIELTTSSQLALAFIGIAKIPPLPPLVGFLVVFSDSTAISFVFFLFLGL